MTLNSTKRGIYEERTRIHLFLPNTNPLEGKAFQRIIGYLKERKIETGIETQKKEPIIKGFTFSSPRPSAFSGFFWSPKEKEWLKPEDVIIIIIDYELRLRDFEIEKEIGNIKNTIAEIYRGEGSEQEEIWVTVHQIWRYD